MFGEEVLDKKAFGGVLISKSYGNKRVLNCAEFVRPLGDIVGIFGLNGSGKTTLLRILSGLDADYTGSLYKTNFDDIAYMSVDNIYPLDMRVKDAIKFHKMFSEKLDKARIMEELKCANINSNALLASLSTGMRQYVKFLLTVYSGASVCLFDEPLSNLDINLRERVKQTLIMEINQNKLFIVTTHELKEFEQLIDGFYILQYGRLSEYYEAERLIATTGQSIGEFYKEKVNAKK